MENRRSGRRRVGGLGRRRAVPDGTAVTPARPTWPAAPLRHCRGDYRLGRKPPRLPARPTCSRRWWHAPAHHRQFAPGFGVADHRRRKIGKHTCHRRQIADVAVDDAEQRDDRGLVGGDAVEVAH